MLTKLEKGLVCIASILFVLIFLPEQLIPINAQTQDQSGIIQLTLTPSIVESGKKTHSIGYLSLVDDKGNPITATKNLQVSLSSKNPDIASVPSLVTIPESQNYVKFDVMAGNDGQTQISAQLQNQTVSQNFGVGEMPGIIPSNSSLQIGIPSSQMNINSQMPLSVYLQYNGTALQAPKDLTISFDYDKSLLELRDDTVTIKKGDYYAVTYVNTFASTGSAYVKARASDLGIDTATNIQISAVGPAKLAINVFPKTIGLNEGKIDVFVSLLDSAGNPTIAPQDIKIGFFSNSSLVENAIKSTVGTLGGTIKKGDFGYYLRIPFPSESTSRTVVIGASQESLGITSDVFNIVDPLSVENPRAVNKALEVYTIGNIPGGANSIVVYQLNAIATGQKLTGTKQFVAENQQPIDLLPAGTLYPIQTDSPYYPTSAASILNVETTDPNIIKINDIGGIDSGSSYGTSIVSSGQKSGNAIVSAVLKGLVAGSSNTTNVVNVINPSKTVIFLPAGKGQVAFNSEGYYDIYFVSVDSNDRTLNTVGGLQYLITPINNIIAINPNSNSADMKISSSELGNVNRTGISTITATPVGATADPSLQASQTFKLKPPTTTIKLMVPFTSVISHNSSDTIGTVQIIDFYGNPVTFPDDMVVNLVSNNTNLISVPSSTVIKAGNSYAQFPVSTYGIQGMGKILVSSPNLIGSSVNVQVILPVLAPTTPESFDLLIKSVDNPVSYNQDEKIKFFLNDQTGSPVGEALIKLSAENATLSSDSVTTDDSGYAQVSFKATGGPTSSLTAHVIKDGFDDLTQTKSLDVTGLKVVSTGLFVGIPGWAIYVGVAGAVGAIGFFAYNMFFKKPVARQVEEEEAEI